MATGPAAGASPGPITPPRRRAPWWAFVVLGLVGVGFIAAFVLTFASFRNESKRRDRPYISGPTQLNNGVVILSKDLSLDPSAESATFRLTFEPAGTYADAEGRLTEPLTVYVDTDKGWVPKAFAKGQVMRPTDVTVPLASGSETDYPFDSYTIVIDVAVDNDAGEPVPSALDVVASVHGFSFKLVSVSAPPDGGHVMTLGIKRSQATRFFSIFVMVLMWALALMAVALMVRLILLGRPIEFPMFTFLAALLFAFPAVRNALPGAPPLGARLDYLSFFWCEVLVAFSLFVMLGTWVIRRNATDP